MNNTQMKFRFDVFSDKVRKLQTYVNVCWKTDNIQESELNVSM